MPYRRLPNTDQARLRAMKTAIDQAEKLIYEKSPIPYDLLYQLRLKYTEFEHLITQYKQAYQNQIQHSQKVKQTAKMAKLYISHFFQSLNMAIQRKELPADVRKFFDLPTNKLTIPRLQTESDIIKWGYKLIQGEQKRILAGQSPLQCPKLSLVKIYFEQFEQNYKEHQRLKQITAQKLQQVAQMRPQIDKLIQNLWNTIENAYSNLPPELMRKKAAQFGVVYVFRKSELNKLQTQKALSA